MEYRISEKELDKIREQNRLFSTVEINNNILIYYQRSQIYLIDNSSIPFLCWVHDTNKIVGYNHLYKILIMAAKDKEIQKKLPPLK